MNKIEADFSQTNDSSEDDSIRIASWQARVKRTQGALADDPLERPDQGEYEQRDEIVVNGAIMSFPVTITPTISTRPLEQSDAPTLFAALEANRDHLDRWLRWSGRIKTVADAERYIQRFQDKLMIGDGFHLGLWEFQPDGDRLIGGFVCHFLNRESNKTEIGYWLSAQHTGKGVITAVCTTMIGYLIREEHIHRIEIQAAADNLKSRAVAERLGFTFESIKRESDWITVAYRDHAMYALLDREWQPNKER